MPRRKRYKNACADVRSSFGLRLGEGKALHSGSPIQPVRAAQMSFLPEVELGEFQPLAAFHRDFGFIPNLLRAQSLLPRVIEAQAILERAVRLNRGAISRAQKERILLCIAAGRQDVYCAGLARTALRRLGESDHQIESLLEDHRRADLPAAEVALLDFCLKLAFHALSVNSSDIDQLRQYGIDDESIIEAAVTVSLAIYRCTLSAGLHPEPDHGAVEAAI